MAIDARPPRPIADADLHAFVDDLLDATRRHEVQDHLDRHPQAAHQVHALRAQRQALRGLFAGVADEPVPERLNLRRIVAERYLPARRTPRWQIAAALVLTTCLGAGGGWWARSANGEAGSGIASLAREADETYAVYGVDPTRPVEIAAEHRDVLDRWVAQRLQRSVPIPDLRRSGFRFVGGRLVATGHGPAAMFIYDGANDTRIALLARRMAVEHDTPVMLKNGGAFGGYSWADKGLGYSLVGNDGALDLHPLADEARRQVRLSL
jgi:anti-sigma factor RsiW